MIKRDPPRKKCQDKPVQLVVPRTQYKRGLVTDGNTQLCCRGFILALFQSTTANKIDS